MSSWAWKSKQPPMAQHRHQVRREAQECWEGRAGAGDSAPEAVMWERGVRRPSALSDMCLRRGEVEVESRALPRPPFESANTGRSMRKPQVPEFISATPLPLRNPKQVKEPKTTHSGQGEVSGVHYPPGR